MSIAARFQCFSPRGGYSMKIIIYGGKGWIGDQLVKLLNNHEIHYGSSRVDDTGSVEREIIEINPTHIICTIGRTHGTDNNKIYPTIDYLEIPGKLRENIKDNLFAPMVLAILCVKYNVHLTYMGTGCIFEYDKDHPFGQEINGFTEGSKPNFFNSSYSIVKGFTDELMHLFELNVLNVRIRMPITDTYNGRNFITKIIKYEKICSVPNSMTVLPELLPYLVDMIERKVVGTINLVNPGLISHDEILMMYKEIVSPSFEWKNFSVQEQSKILAAGRSNNYLSTDKLEHMYPSVKNIKDAVRDVLYQMKLNLSEQHFIG